jgi:hypothetical protein
MEQSDVRWIVFVPVGALVLVASRARIHEVVAVVGPSPKAWAVMIERERCAGGVFVNAAVSAS